MESAPVGTQVASLDIKWAYHNSPIAPKHKPYLAVSWNDGIYVGHCVVEGLVTVGGIQGCPSDALLDFFHYCGIENVFKWVDDMVIFQPLSSLLIHPGSIILNTYAFNLNTVFHIMTPLGIPWHPIETKGQDFASSVKYVGFQWDLETHHVFLTGEEVG